MDYKETDRRAVDAAMRKAFKPDKDLPERLRDLLRRLSDGDRGGEPKRS